MRAGPLRSSEEYLRVVPRDLPGRPESAQEQEQAESELLHASVQGVGVRVGVGVGVYAAPSSPRIRSLRPFFEKSRGRVGTGVDVGRGVRVGRGVFVSDGVRVCVGVNVGRCVCVGTGVGVFVNVGVTVGVKVAVWPPAAAPNPNVSRSAIVEIRVRINSPPPGRR